MKRSKGGKERVGGRGRGRGDEGWGGGEKVEELGGR